MKSERASIGELPARSFSNDSRDSASFGELPGRHFTGMNSDENTGTTEGEAMTTEPAAVAEEDGDII